MSKYDVPMDIGENSSVISLRETTAAAVETLVPIKQKIDDLSTMLCDGKFYA